MCGACVWQNPSKVAKSPESFSALIIIIIIQYSSLSFVIGGNEIQKAANKQGMYTISFSGM